jgi:hypothetical protein
VWGILQPIFHKPAGCHKSQCKRPAKISTGPAVLFFGTLASRLESLHTWNGNKTKHQSNEQMGERERVGLNPEMQANSGHFFIQFFLYKPLDLRWFRAGALWKIKVNPLGQNSSDCVSFWN